MFYRVKQFLWSISSQFKKIDEVLIKKYLNENEIILFSKLTSSDKHHCIRVCNDAIKMVNDDNIIIDKYKLGKIALLHDIGKGSYSLNPIEKSIFVILNKITNGKLKHFNKNKKVDSYYNHPIKGVELLSVYDIYDNEFLDVVKNHHCEDDSKNIYLKIIKECDDKN